MRRLPQPPVIVNKEIFALWLVLCLSILPMTVPVFAAMSGHQAGRTSEMRHILMGEDDKTARPLKAEVLDNTLTAPEGAEALDGSISTAPDILLTLLSVCGVAYLGWRFTLRYQVRQ